ncbi:MAG: hypothetical protein ACE5GD_08670 [Candidatus Geothermarchaeales archaeon]
MKILGPGGHERQELSPEEAERLVYKNGERYLVVDWETKRVLQE